jgi:hypothetical protein
MASHRRQQDHPRKHRRVDQSGQTPQIPPSAYVTAYEAPLVYDRVDLAEAVTRRDDGGQGEAIGSGSGARGSLIKWSGEREGEEEIWLDR